MAYTPEEIENAFNIIMDQIKEGRSLNSVLNDKTLGVKMPCDNTFDKWCADDEEKMTHYMRAREARADKIFEEILIIADKQDSDVVKNEDGEDVVNHNVIQRSRLQIDARKWMIGKMQPKKYGDSLDLTSGGEKISVPSIPIVLQDGRTFEDLRNELQPE